MSIDSGTAGTITFRLYAWDAAATNGWFRIARKNAWADLGITGPGMRIWGNITTTATNDTESNIVESSFDEPDNINYTLYNATSGLTTSNAIKIGEFVIQDGGDDLTDTDLVSTFLTDISVDLDGNSNIAALAIFDGTTNVGETSSISTTTSINGLNSGSGIEATDNSSKTFDVYATFNTNVIDNEQIQLTISSATSDAVNGSTFTTFNAGGAQTSITGDDNRLEVTSSSLSFNQEPTDTNQFETMTPFPVVYAVDANGNQDLDANGDVDYCNSWFITKRTNCLCT